MRISNFLCLFIMTFVGSVEGDYFKDYSNTPGTTYSDTSENKEGEPGYWNQNPHHYGNWNRNQYNNQPGAYQNPNNRTTTPQTNGGNRGQFQNQSNINNRNAGFQNREIAEAENPYTTTPSSNTVWKNYGDNTTQTSDQVTNAADTKITRSIQEALQKESSLSSQGQNVIINSTNGVVTLKGKVLTPAESEKVQTIAGKVEGVKSINNQLQSINPTNSTQQ